MHRSEKTEFVDQVRGAFAEAPLVILTDFKGSTVAQMDAVRRKVEEAGASFRVVKNTLCRIAVADTEKEALQPHFRGNIGVVFSGEDPVATAKVFRALLKENEKLELRAGFFEGEVIDAKAVDAVADLPSREELLATLLQTLLAAPRQVLGVIQAPARDLLYLLKNYAAKLEEGN